MTFEQGLLRAHYEYNHAAITWVRLYKGDDRQAWAECQRPDWMLSYLQSAININAMSMQQTMLWTRCKVALARGISLKQLHPLSIKALAVASKFAHGKAELQEMIDAANLAWYRADCRQYDMYWACFGAAYPSSSFHAHCMDIARGSTSDIRDIEDTVSKSRGLSRRLAHQADIIRQYYSPFNT